MDKYLNIILVPTVLLLLAIITFLPADIKSFVLAKTVSLLDSLISGHSSLQDTFHDKKLISNLGHVFTFMLLGFVFGWRDTGFSKKFFFVTLIVIASASEISQHFIIGRKPSWEDFTINIVAGLIGYALIKQVNISRKPFDIVK